MGFAKSDAVDQFFLPLLDQQTQFFFGAEKNKETISCFNHPFSGAFAVGFREGKLLELTTSSSVCDFLVLEGCEHVTWAILPLRPFCLVVSEVTRSQTKNQEVTPRKTSIAPENRPLEKEVPIGNHHF